MVVAEEYTLKYDEHREGYIVLCWQQHTCPDCHGPLSGYDRRRRCVTDLEGATRSYYLRRLRCAGCGKLHTENITQILLTTTDFLLRIKYSVTLTHWHKIK